MILRLVWLLMLLGSAPGWAQCSDRPGTPTDVRLEPNETNNSLNLIWRNTTRGNEQAWFDIYFRDEDNNPIGRDMTGALGGVRPYGTGSAYLYADLTPGKRYCASMRARSGAGTQGCVSEITSNRSCATVPLVASAVRVPAEGRSPAPPAGEATPVPPRPRQCDVVADIRVTGCLNYLDGSPSEYFTSGNTSGCGATEAEAILAAGLAYGASLGDGPGQCQYTKVVSKQACACTLPVSVAGARLAAGGRGAWSAFSIGADGHWGQGVHRDSFADASRAAMAECGNAGCKVTTSTTDRCVAFAESRQGGFWWAVGGGLTEANASANAVRYCQNGTAPAGSCGVARVSCRP